MIFDSRLRELMEKAKSEPGTPEEKTQKVQMVQELVQEFMVMGSKTTKNKSLPLRIRRPPPPPQVLPDKIRQSQGAVRDDFGLALQNAPQLSPGRGGLPSKARPTPAPFPASTTLPPPPPTTPDFTQVLLNKVNSHKGDRGEHFADYLDLPEAEGEDYENADYEVELDSPAADEVQYEDFTGVLLNKVKSHQV